MRYDWIVVGAGFEGSFLALRLAELGKKVCLIEATRNPGGLLKGFTFNDFQCDVGTQNFDFRSRNIENYVTSVLGDNVKVSNWSWSSRYKSLVVNQAEMIPLDRDFLVCILNQGQGLGRPRNFEDKLILRYGNQVFREIQAAVQKIARVELGSLSDENPFLESFFRRIFVSDDAEIRHMKRVNVAVDNSIGVPLSVESEPNYVLYRHAYPARGSMRAFVTALEARFAHTPNLDCVFGSPITQIGNPSPSELSVLVRGSSIRSDHVFWAGPAGPLQVLLGQTSVVDGIFLDHYTYVFKLQSTYCSDDHYQLLYDPDIVPYRVANSGIYSHQVSADGMTYCHAEVLRRSDEDPPEIQDVWRGVLRSDLVEDSAVSCGAMYHRRRRAYRLATVRENQHRFLEGNRVMTFPRELGSRTEKLNWINRVLDGI